MNRLTARFLLAAIVLFTAVSTPHAQTMKAYRFARVWDGTTVIPDAVVVVEGDKVVSAAAGAGALPKGIEVVDLPLAVAEVAQLKRSASTNVRPIAPSVIEFTKLTVKPLQLSARTK